MRHIKEETLLHFVGIGGIGMSGIAEVFLNQGFRVTGSDRAESETTKRLGELGAHVYIGHTASNVTGASVVIISSAIRPENPEILEARRLRIPIIPRAEMLGELMRGKVGIAVAGTHGKTTTTSMLATVLTEAQLDPTLVIGGKVNSFGGNAKRGQGDYVVAEADESDGSFLHLPATYGVVTNIDNDHLDHFGTLAAVEQAFIEFVAKLPFYGMAAVCGDDPGIKRCLNRFTKPFSTYGFSPQWDLYADHVVCEGLGSRFRVMHRTQANGAHQELGEVQLFVPGRHNILNALASISIALKLDLPFPMIAQGLSAFRGVKRRFDIRWRNEEQQQVIIDDYAHHPTEIAATLQAARGFWPGRIITVFQPHRYSRTLLCRDAFFSALSPSDVVFITDIYAAGEDPIEGVDSKSLVEEMKRAARSDQHISYGGDLQTTHAEITQIFSPGDLILCLGAGSITRLPDQLMLHLKPESFSAKG